MVTRNDLYPMTANIYTFALTHLFYADDILLFCHYNSQNVKNIVSFRSDYGRLSGKLVSWEKSFMYFGRAVSDVGRLRLSSVVGMKMQPDFLLFGFFSISDAPKVTVLRPIANAILSKLEIWKG